MAEDRKSLKERLASIRESKQSAHKEAKVRVASAWTLAKSMLPTAPNEIQFKLASSLLGNDTKSLTAMLRQTAINAHYTKVAEKFEQMHKVELNEFLENESFLKKMQNEVKSELKGEAKSAKAKKADEAPVEEDAMPPAPEEGEEAPLDEAPLGDEGEAPLGDDLGGEEAPLGDDLGGEEAPMGDTAIPDEKKEELQEKIDNLSADVEALEESIEGEEELDFSKIFDEGDMEDKTDSLANEGEGEGDEFGFEDEGEEDGMNVEADGGASFFGSEPNELEQGLATATPDDFFHHASRHDISSLDVLLSDSKTASDKIVERGEMGEDLLDENGVPDNEEDHDDVILYEVLKGLKSENYDPGTKRVGQPKLEAPKPGPTTSKAGAKKASTLRSLGNVKNAGDGKEQDMLARLVFADDL